MKVSLTTLNCTEEWIMNEFYLSQDPLSRYFEAWHLIVLHKAAKFAALAVICTSQVLLRWHKTIIVVGWNVFEETNPLLRGSKVTTIEQMNIVL